LTIVLAHLLLTPTEICKEVIIVISEETLKWISAAESPSKNFVCLGIAEALPHAKAIKTTSEARKISLLWCC
jgi:hypothetical protein